MRASNPTQPSKSRIKRLCGASALAIVSATLLLASRLPARADDQDSITYRQLIMKQIDAETAAIGLMLSGQIPPDSLGFETRALALAAKAAPKAFQPNVPGGEAKPEVWSKWDDFSKYLQTLAEKSDEMAKAADTGGVASVTDIAGALPCKQCHDLYRNKKQ